MKRCGACIGLVCVVLSGVASAESRVGYIEVSMTLQSSCLINNSVANHIGNLDFGTSDTFLTTKTASVLSPDGLSMTIQCSAGLEPTLTILGGSNKDEGGDLGEAMTDGAGHYIPYGLFTDSGRTTPLPDTGVYPLEASDGTAQLILLFGQADVPVGLPGGVYTDRMGTSLDF